ncbi:efflux RND transporter permease subunit [candidate division KSB1 bacterium]
MNFPRFAVKYPISIAMLFLGIILLGVISLNKLGTDLLPDIASPKINVRLEAGEKPPEEIERKYTKSIESFASQLNDVKRVTSSSLTGVSLVTVEYNWDTDMDFALLDIQKAVAAFSSDREVQNISVDRFDPRTAPIMTLSITPKTDRNLDEIRNDAEKVVKLRLERLEGVAAALIAGGREKELVVRIKPYHLMAYELSPANIISKIQSTNVNQSGGQVEENDKVYIVKGIGEFQTIDDIRNLVVGYKSRSADIGAGQQGGAMTGAVDQVPVYLREVADVEFIDKDYKSLVRLDGIEGVGIAVYKEAQSNTVTTSRLVRDTLEDLRRDLPEVDILIASDQADFIIASINEVEIAALIGIILAIFVLTIFLRNIWATFIVALSIPISIIATFNLMYFNELTLNIMTLGGLALGAGMLVDNSIVVMENIFRHRSLGKSKKEAAISGTGEVGAAIAASTLTTLIVFVPIFYTQGIGTELFKDQAKTVAFSLLSSLFVAFLLIPALASRTLTVSTVQDRSRLRSRLYDRILKSAIDRKWTVIVIAAGLALLTIQALNIVGTEFIPRSDQQQFTVNMRLPEGTRIETTSNVSRIVEDLIRENSGGFVESVYSEIGYQEQAVVIDEERGPNTARLYVRMKQDQGGYLPTAQFIEAIQPAIEEIPDMRSEFIMQESAVEQTMGGLVGGLVVSVRGPELNQLDSLSKEVAKQLESIEGLSNIKTSSREGRPEINIVLDKVITAGLNLTMDQAVNAVRNRISENVVSEFQYAGDERDIRVTYPEISIEELEGILITTSQGAIVTLKNIADLELVRGPKEIRREEQDRAATVTADISEEVQYSSVIEQVSEAISGIDVPRDYRISISGEERARRESFDQLRFALILAFVLVYMVLAALFESFIHPFTIMFAVPMALIGSVLIFLIIGLPLSIMAVIGMIMLAGIAVNDAIIFVDYINNLRRKGMDRRDAVLQAGQDRVRPIIMTSLTTILALTPLIIGIGEGASLRAPLAYAVIGGLTTSTLMTLILTPCLYLILDNLRPLRVRDKVA